MILPLPQAPHTDKNGSSIDFFKNNFLKGGLSRPTRYSVLIETNAFEPTRMLLQPEGVIVPGRSFRTFQDNLWGPIRKVPVSRTFENDLVMLFPVGNNCEERTIFEAWMDKIINPITNVTSYSDDGETAKGTITLYCTNEMNETKAVFNFEEVYPSSIIPMNMGFDQINQYNRLQVVFTYRQYTYKAENFDSSSPPTQ